MKIRYTREVGTRKTRAEKSGKDKHTNISTSSRFIFIIVLSSQDHIFHALGRNDTERVEC